MKIIRPLLYVLLILVGAFSLFLLYATIDDYQPEEILDLGIECEADTFADSLPLDLLIWNIGYAGLDASMDFFYDGGEQMRPEKEGVLANMEGISNMLATFRNFNFILLQEVDQDSRRSYHVNQYDQIKEQFPGFHSSFGMNYDVSFVPIPPGNPMGRVKSGLMTLSRQCPAGSERYSFPGNYSWPMKLFMLDRCFLVNRYLIDDQKELVLINTHNSAYDDGSLRSQQMSYLSAYLLSEYEKGNYVIVGGDWNQTPFGLEPELPSHIFDTKDLIYIEENYPGPGWQWAYDPDMPTNRRVAFPYDQSSSPTTIIDCYLLSPNIELNHVETIDIGFKLSDHQPVKMQIRLSSNP